MISIGLLSDTHGFCDEVILRELEKVDLILHAGDIGTTQVAERLARLKPLHAVYGNVDSAELRIEFPEFLTLELEEVKLGMTHIAGSPPSYNKVVRKYLDDTKPDLFICGHSHILKVGRDAERQLLFVNPGAAGQHGFHKMRTMIRFQIDGKTIKGMEVLELGKRGAIP